MTTVARIWYEPDWMRRTSVFRAFGSAGAGHEVDAWALGVYRELFEEIAAG